MKAAKCGMPSNAPTDFGKPEDWIRHAESDLALARSRTPGVLIEHRCYHAQQAAEKAIKAVFVAHKNLFPFTHNIGWLVDLLRKKGVEVPEGIARASHLSDYAAETRYPMIAVEKSELAEAIRKAAAALEWAKKEIGAMKPAKKSAKRRRSS
jgi:HEPN domain-containing protein